MDASVLIYIQVVLAIIMGLYFWNLLKTQEVQKVAVGRESRKELERLRQMREIKLTEPLSEKTRPADLDEVIGQEEGIRALKAALCGPNPQHVIIYGPPGVGKTAAARLVLEEAKKSGISPFCHDARFIEIDATTARFDERGIADPLIGSVHDPIYQGAGAMGVAGIPQPKPGAVTKAHGGMLFLDEIGELHPIQMNKLLKVLEDRKVHLESVYYSPEDPNIPEHIHDIFQNGLPADFRLVGATTKSPEEMAPALRSRCLEIFFRSLSAEEIGIIARGAARKAGAQLEEGAVETIMKFADNGRDAVNLVQLGVGLITVDGRMGEPMGGPIDGVDGLVGRPNVVTQGDIEWIISQGRYSPRRTALFRRSSSAGSDAGSADVSPDVAGSPADSAVGSALGLAVYGPGLACVIDVETAIISEAAGGKGAITITGVIEEEELGKGGHVLKRKSMILSSIENVRTALALQAGLRPHSWDIHVNFPGGTPVDGPSAGLAIAVSMHSAMRDCPVDRGSAFTGEISIRGEVRPVGGIDQKIRAAEETGLARVYIPEGNWQSRFCGSKVQVIPVATLQEVFASLQTFPD